MAQHTIDLPCIADTWVDSMSPTVNHGIDTTLKCGQQAFPTCQTLLKFNLSLLPVRKKITSAKIRVFNHIAKTYSPFARFMWNLIRNTWIEESATWNIVHETQLFNSDTVYSLPANQYVEAEVTDLIGITNNENGVCFTWYNAASGSEDRYIYFSSRETVNPPILRLVYEDVPPDKPIPKYPNGQYIDNKTIARFDWNYISSVGGDQKKFDLQYSTNNGSTWTTVSQVTPNTYYDMPASTLPSGTVMWRVQTYNEYDEASGYSDVYSFYSIGAPAEPAIISVANNTAKPTVSWTATQQEVYQLQVLQDDNIIYDTGNRPYTEYSFKLPVFLPDDTYAVKVRVQNEYGLWSSWAETLVQIATDKPHKPEALFQGVRNGIEVIVTNDVTAEYFLLLRNDIPVFKTTNKILYDYAAEHGKEYQYKIRAVSANDTYMDNDIRLLSTKVLSNVFAPVAELDNMLELRYNLNQRPDKNFISNTLINTMYVHGRKHSIIEKSEHIDKSISFLFVVKDYEHVQRISKFSEDVDILLYRDSRGKKLYGYVAGFGCKDVSKGYQVSFTLNAINYTEGLYD